MTTILVVDDEEEIASAVRSILEDEGYGVKLCADGEQALAYLATGAVPDLVLSDVMMPRVGGLELLGRIRADVSLEAVPVVLMSAVPPGKALASARWNAFLKKPFNLDALLGVVQAQLEAK